MVDDITYGRKKKGKCKEGENDSVVIDKQQAESPKNQLATLDIFAGCGGLSEGLQQSGNLRSFTLVCTSAFRSSLVVLLRYSLFESCFIIRFL